MFTKACKADTPPSYREPTMSAEANTARLQRFADEVLSGHNLAALDEIFHADYVEDVPPPGMGPGREGLRQWLASWIAAFPDVRWTVEEQIADEDRVWSRSIWRGTHQGSFLGIPPTGKNVAVAAWTIDRFTDGKIAESRIIMDTLGLMQQLGVIPAPAAPPT
jgi:steroid delta-isomerase-like uncharacterized protein